MSLVFDGLVQLDPLPNRFVLHVTTLIGKPVSNFLDVCISGELLGDPRAVLIESRTFHGWILEKNPNRASSGFERQEEVMKVGFNFEIQLSVDRGPSVEADRFGATRSCGLWGVGARP